MAFKPRLSVLHFAARLDMVLEGRRIAPGASRERKVRTPKGAMPRNSVAAVYDRRKTKIHAGGKLKDFLTDSATENQTACVSQETPVRVKRCGKSAPRRAQAMRHGKPHRVQGQIGNPRAARSRFRESETDSGYRLHRQMILSPGEIRGRQNSAYSPSKTNSNSQILIQNHRAFPAANRLGLFDCSGRTHIANPIHRADHNDLRPGIFKRPRRLIGR